MISMCKTKQSIFASLILSGLFLFCAVPVQAALEYEAYDAYLDDWALDLYGWSINTFDAEIEVRNDATFLVTETIDVSYGIDKHGIYREIPSSYRDAFGNRVTIDIDVLSVYQDGQPAVADVYQSGDDRVIKIGDPGLTIRGDHSYTIVYEVERAFLYDDNATTLYWNVTGTDWEVPIDSSSVAVVFPDGVEPMQWSCYVGEYGSTYQNCGEAQDGEVVAFAANGFITIAIDIPPGSIWEPALYHRFWWFFLANWVALFPLALLVAALRWWWMRGRDPKDHRTIIAQYEPPDGLWAAYVGTLLTNGPRKRFITAMIIQMASEGTLTIEVTGQKKKKTPANIILKKKTDGSELDPAHKQLFDLVFKTKDERKVSSIKGKLQPSQLSVVRQLLLEQLSPKYLMKKSFTYQVIGITFGVAIILSSPLFGMFFGTVTGVMFVVSGIGVLVLGILMPKVTNDGAIARWHAKGFELFLKTADQYRHAFQEREEIFSMYLPYAIALNHVDEWIKAFGDLQAPPDWYHSTYPFLAQQFASDLTQMTSAIGIATAPVAPSSGGSYSGGGGSSGGGFGGGGGGSW